MQVLFEKHKFRQTPFEWVYDGLSPVLLHDVLESRKGLSIVLAMIYVIVAKPFGHELAMARVPDGPHEDSLAGGVFCCLSRKPTVATAHNALQIFVTCRSQERLTGCSPVQVQ